MTRLIRRLYHAILASHENNKTRTGDPSFNAFRMEGTEFRVDSETDSQAVKPPVVNGESIFFINDERVSEGEYKWFSNRFDGAEEVSSTGYSVGSAQHDVERSDSAVIGEQPVPSFVLEGGRERDERMGNGQASTPKEMHLLEECDHCGR